MEGGGEGKLSPTGGEVVLLSLCGMLPLESNPRVILCHKDKMPILHLITIKPHTHTHTHTHAHTIRLKREKKEEMEGMEINHIAMPNKHRPI